MTTGDERSNGDRLVRGPKLGEVVAQRIRKRILIGELQEGDFLSPEPELMERFGVSRPTIREALSVLEAEALIETRRGSHTGAVVRAPSLDLAARYNSLLLHYRGVTLKDINRLREIVEPAVVAEATMLQPEKLADRLSELFDVEEKHVGNPVEFGHAANEFHLAFTEFAGSQALAISLRQQYWLLERLIDRVQNVPNPDYHRNANGSAHRAHGRMVDLVRLGKATEAAALWREHIAKSGERLLSHEVDAGTVLDLLG